MSTELYTGRVIAPEAGHPLVFAFHGTGGSGAQFASLARQILPGAGVVAPDGDVSEYGAARFFRRTGEGVYDMDDLAQRVDKMIRYVEAHKAAWPDRPAYAFGYSNGANILAAVAMARPDLFARIGLLHPLIPWTPDPVPGLAHTSVLVTAGRHDPITPWPESQRLIAWLNAQGADMRTVLHPGGHELRQEELTALADLLTAPEPAMAG